METKSNVDWMHNVRDRCGFKNSFIVPCNGLSGGLALFWKSEATVHVQNATLTYIDARVKGGGYEGQWHLTGFYGNLITSLRPESWRTLQSISSGSQLPWVVIGDFNEIIGEQVKEGGSQRPYRQMVRFRDAIRLCGLYEVKFIGPMFTWLYQTREGTQIRERLDRVLVSKDWSTTFPDVMVIHKSASTSDHSQLLLVFRLKPKRMKPRRLFRFESMWLKDPTFE